MLSKRYNGPRSEKVLPPPATVSSGYLTNMQVWSLRNNIDFNASKCKTLSVTRKKSPLLHQYSTDGVQLERVLNERDLGVTITSTLSWELHIQSITAKANKVLGLLKRTCHLLKDNSVRRTLYLSLRARYKDIS